MPGRTDTSYDHRARHHDHRSGAGHGPGRGPGRDRRSGSGRGAGRGCDRGQVAIEYLGFIPVLMLVALAVIQTGLVAHAAQQAGTAARAGARAASLGMSAQQGCREAVSASLSSRTSCAEARGGDTVTVTATVRIPSVIPFWNPIGDTRRTATMPLDH